MSGDPIADAFANAGPGPFVERDGTIWTVHLGPTSEPGMYVTKPYVLVRQQAGGTASEVARVESSGWTQENPVTSGGVEWRFYIAADGTFRAVREESRTTGDGALATTQRTYAAFRFDGKQLVPAEP